jgi:uncharacterized membrane protein
MPSIQIKTKFIISFIIIASIGFLDAVYLTSKYFVGTINCGIWTGCQEVLNSSYSSILGFPTAGFGVLYYLSIIIAALLYWQTQHKLNTKYLMLAPSLGFIFTLWLVYLQVWVIKYICVYCMLSALSSTILFIFSLLLYKQFLQKTAS